MMISLPQNTTCSFATEKYRLQTLPYLETTVEALTIQIDVPVSVLLNTSAQEIEAAIQSLQERAITTFSLEEAKEEMRQIQYRSNNTNRATATIAVIGALSLAVAAMISAAACKRHARISNSASRTAQENHQGTAQSMSLSTISTTGTLTSAASTEVQPSTSPAKQNIEELNRPIYSTSDNKKKKGSA